MSTIVDPLSIGNFENAEIQRIAWPLMTAPFVVPLTINGRAPVGVPEVICMTGCPVPPCSPTYQCPPGDLWWSVAFSSGSLIVSPSDPLRLPDDLSTPPPLFAFLWDTYVSIPSMSPSIIPKTQTVTSVVAQTIITTQTPTKTPIASQIIVPNSSIQNSSTGSNSTGPGLTIAYIFVGIFGIITIVSVYCTIMLYRYAQCPYCYFIIRVGAPFLTHLNECEEHLKRFTPLTPVTSISLENNDGPRLKPHTTQLVFAPRPGPRLVAPNFVSETLPRAKREGVVVEKELLGRTRTNTNDEIVVELSTQQIAAP